MYLGIHKSKKKALPFLNSSVVHHDACFDFSSVKIHNNDIHSMLF